MLLRQNMLSRPSSSKSHARSTHTRSVRSRRFCGVGLAILLATLLQTAVLATDPDFADDENVTAADASMEGFGGDDCQVC